MVKRIWLAQQVNASYKYTIQITYNSTTWMSHWQVPAMLQGIIKLYKLCFKMSTYPYSYLGCILFFQRQNMICIKLSDFYLIWITMFPSRISSVDFRNCVKIHHCGSLWRASSPQMAPGKRTMTWVKELLSKSLESEFLTLAEITNRQPTGWWQRGSPCLCSTKPWNKSVWES